MRPHTLVTLPLLLNVLHPESRQPAKSFQVGDTVEVLWSGTWELAVLKAARPDGGWRVGYVGWDTKWDQDVKSTLVRARAATRPGDELAALPSRKGPADIPAGTYQCMQTVSHFAGSSYVNGRAMPRYRFTFETRGTLTVGSGSYRMGTASAASYRYEASTSRIQWLSGPFADRGFAGGWFQTDKRGTPQVMVRVKSDGPPAEWTCTRQ